MLLKLKLKFKGVTKTTLSACCIDIMLLQFIHLFLVVIKPYTPVKPYIKGIYRLINLISDYHTVVRTVSRYPDIVEKKTIKMKAIFNQCIVCVNNTIETFYRPRITKQIALLCTKKTLIGEQNQRKL